MQTDDITQIYETLAPMAGQYANAQAEQIGQAQRSMGPLAANTMGTTTAGLGNYTYNRLMRPQVDVMRDEILVEGYRNQLNRALSDAYNTARKNYSRSSSGGSGSGSGNKTSNSGKNTGVTTIGDVVDKSTGSGKTTTWTVLPNSYQWQDDDGNWHTAVRDKSISDDYLWLRYYEDAKNKYAPQGRFKG